MHGGRARGRALQGSPHPGRGVSGALLMTCSIVGFCFLLLQFWGEETRWAFCRHRQSQLLLPGAGECLGPHWPAGRLSPSSGQEQG